MSTVHVLCGPEAGRGRAGGVYATVTDVLAAAGAEVVDLTATDAAGAEAAARAAVADGATRLVVVGGDGSVHLALQAVAGTGTALGIVPVGTGNDFVRGLPGFPTTPHEAALAALGDPVALDALRAGDRWIASVATAGFSADVNERANRLRFPRGASRYSVATVLELPGLRHRHATLVVDGAAQHHEITLLAVGNTAWFGGGMRICPDADPTDGLLDITVVGPVGRLELLRFFRLVFDGRHLDHPQVTTLRAREVVVDAPGSTVWGDGDPVGTGPITLRTVPEALNLAWPR